MNDLKSVKPRRGQLCSDFQRNLLMVPREKEFKHFVVRRKSRLHLIMDDR